MPDIQSMGEYKEQVTDEQLINMIENGVQNSVGCLLYTSPSPRDS